MDRRSFLAAMPGLAAAARYFPETPKWGGRRLDAIGVQIYTLRQEMAADAPKTLNALAAIGYDELELFGPYSLMGRDMRRQLDANGLRAASSHIGIDAVRGSWDETLESAQELGQALIVVPSLPGNERDSEALRAIADEFNAAGEAARAAGIRFGYHNHQWEVEVGDDGSRPIDLLMERTDPALVDWQMDIYWTVDGGADPLVDMERYAGRVTSVHVKDRTTDGEMVDVGAGVIDFGTILSRAEELGLRHQFIEHDRPGDALESVRASFNAVKALGS